MLITFSNIIKFQFLAQFSVDPQWVLSCLVIYSLCASLLNSLIIWLTVSFLSPLNLHLLFCFVLSIFALTWLVLMALFCAAIRRDSVSLKSFSFLTMIRFFRVRFYWFVAWNIHTIVFLPISVSWLFCSAYLYAACAVSGRCNKSFFVLFNVVFESSYWCIDAIFNASVFSFSFFLWHKLPSLCHLSDVKPCVLSPAFLSSGPFVEVLPSSTSRMV